MPDFLNDHGEILKHGDDLPHWQQGEVVQFVTFRLGDSMPASKLRQWREIKEIWHAGHPGPLTPDLQGERDQHFSRSLEKFLDEGAGSCLFKEPANRKILEETLMHDQGGKVIHHAWVIMPNHVHLLFTPTYPLEKIIQTWKSVSARKMGKGPIWQGNYRDTLVRDWDHFINAVRYIRGNPRRLPEGSYTLWLGDRALRIS